MTGFLLIYGLTTIAVLLTGNFFVSHPGRHRSSQPDPVFSADGLCLDVPCFFMTINYRGTDVLQRIAVNGSPFSYYISLVGDGMGLSPDPSDPGSGEGNGFDLGRTGGRNGKSCGTDGSGAFGGGIDGGPGAFPVPVPAVGGSTGGPWPFP